MPALVLTRFQKSDGTTVRRDQEIPPLSRATIEVGTLDGLAAAEFSTLVEADVQVVVDRTMTWPTTGAAPGYGAHAERGILTRSATTWYLAEGATLGTFDLFYLIQNPSPTPRRRRSDVPAAQRGAGREDLRGAGAEPVQHLGGPGGAGAGRRGGLGGGAVDQRGADHPGAGDVSHDAGAGLRGGARERGRDGAGDELVPGRGRDGRVVRPLHPGGEPEPAGGDARGAVPADERAGDHQALHGRPQQPVQHLGGPGGCPSWPTRRCPRRITSTNGVPIIVERAMWWPGPTPATGTRRTTRRARPRRA